MQPKEWLINCGVVLVMALALVGGGLVLESNFPSGPYNHIYWGCSGGLVAAGIVIALIIVPLIDTKPSHTRKNK